MCTVTYIPTANDIFLTSNRDEHSTRKQALAPKQQGSLLYPTDATANGTWIAANSNNGNAIVLLNGAFQNHAYHGPYTKSRGLVLLDIANSTNMVQAFSNYNLHLIEPFTLVIFQNNFLYECRWDGITKHTQQLQHTQPHIWSSVTLYPPAIQQQRQQWFKQWLLTANIQANSILHFHTFTQQHNTENGLCMNRNNALRTVSITQIHINHTQVQMQYVDIIANQQYTLTAPINKFTAYA
jgi:hypothetical protein